MADIDPVFMASLTRTRRKTGFVIRSAAKLLAALQRAGPAGMTRSQFHQRNGRLTATSLDEALELLAKQGKADRISVLRRQVTEVWFAIEYRDYFQSVGDPVADKILVALEQSKYGILRHAIRDVVGIRVDRARRIDVALTLLMDSGRARVVHRLRPTGGWTEIWRLARGGKAMKTPRTLHRLPMAPTIDVEVTPQIIDTAIPRDSGRCMIHDALVIAYPKADPLTILVDTQTIRLSDHEKGLRYIYLTPRAAQNAILDWDQGVQILPFSFRLRDGKTKLTTKAQQKASARRRTQMTREEIRAESLRNRELGIRGARVRYAHEPTSHAKIRALLNAGLSKAEIARRMNVSVSVVYRLARQGSTPTPVGDPFVAPNVRYREFGLRRYAR